MGLLALMNPQAAGLISDDGFMMGRFTWPGTLDLLHTGTSVGLIGGLLYLGLRAAFAERARLRRLLFTTGGALVFGAGTVRVEGRDFTVLHPMWLSVLLFLALPALYFLLTAAMAALVAGSGIDLVRGHCGAGLNHAAVGGSRTASRE